MNYLLMERAGIFVRKKRAIIGAFLISILLWSGSSLFHRAYSQKIPGDTPGNIRVLLDTLPPLSHDRQERPLLYQYSVGDLSNLSNNDARWVIRELAKRGVGVITFWQKGEARESRIEEGIRIAKIQEELGLRVAVDATRILYRFYDASPSTAHIDKEGKAFFDSSFAGRTMGCPFTLHKRLPVIKSRVAAYVEAYHAAGADIDIVTADWEIDGPHEWNQAWEHARRCVRCQENIPNIEDFKAFQAKLRSLRSNLIKKVYTGPILQKFPEALISNYAYYPNDGWRYWYDYFESPRPDLPHRKDQQALYRPWYDEFTESGLTMAMPVTYTWYPIYQWYPEYSSDYRWFYNMLKVGSNAAKSTPSGIPIANFVHWHTTSPPDKPDPDVQQMSRESYKELLWHLLFRGHDLLFSWCRRSELATEMSLLQEVYNKSLEYNEWIQNGRPITFNVPGQEKSVVSGLKRNDRVLVRRTDFTDYTGSITLSVDGKKLTVPYNPGECQILHLE
ncbi:MAG: hypothetical protein ACOCTM_01395 [Bacteroidota bacterium]